LFKILTHAAVFGPNNTVRAGEFALGSMDIPLADPVIKFGKSLLVLTRERWRWRLRTAASNTITIINDINSLKVFILINIKYM